MVKAPISGQMAECITEATLMIRSMALASTSGLMGALTSGTGSKESKTARESTFFLMGQ